MKLTLAFVLLVGVFAHARYINHRRHSTHQMDLDRWNSLEQQINGVPIELLLNKTPSRLVPINNAMFFRTYEPCEEGYKRDVLGICREVFY